jgi:1,4-alpha-glucan branching enzyme
VPKSNDVLSPELRELIEARHPDPFALLGRHRVGDRVVVRTLMPATESVTIAEGDLAMQRITGTDLFEWWGDDTTLPERYRFIWRDASHREHIAHDPYCFGPQIDPRALELFAAGRHYRAQQLLGARVHEADGVAGILFTVWAPNARRVSVVGDFNRWDGRAHPMRLHPNHGVWELFIPDRAPGCLYKFEIKSRLGDQLLLKADPYGRRYQLRPDTASIVEPPSEFVWQDDSWLADRAEWDWQHRPMSIYEVHLASWQRGPEGELLSYRELAHRLVDHVKDLGFSHIELLPITEHPYDKSWGYQTTGYFAPTSRFGSPDDFRYFVDHCHRNGIGIILDWVPAHFPKDAHGLARFDGSALYEHEDPRKGEHLDWATLIYNYDRREVKSFLISSALGWVEEFHVDGLRVDAVASMLYLDYSRDEWIPNQYGGNENLEAIAFLRQFNEVVHAEAPGVLIMAEESTSWPQVSKPTYLGGLGFDLKWNMGWMNDTLSYMAKDPIHRQYHHDKLTFSMLYAFTENFLLPLSHDEVVHGKGSLRYKMPGDDWQRFANLRLLLAYMFTHPGKKLLFMGSELGQGPEWNSEQVLDWYVLQYPEHQGVRQLVRDLNHLYRGSPALYSYEFDWHGFEWIDCHDAGQSALSFLRTCETECLLVIVNFTPVVRRGYRIGIPFPGSYREIFNSDSQYYGGSNIGNGPWPVEAQFVPWMDRPYSIELTLPPLAAIVLKPEQLSAEPPTDRPAQEPS